jgi:site-specific DNA-methyltransferase (adenine-specific)
MTTTQLAEPVFTERGVTVYHGDSTQTLQSIPGNTVDAVVTDPPYGLSKEPDAREVLEHWLAGDDYTHTGSGFMGRTWDSFVPGPAVWRECFRVLKPGGHLLAFFGTRTADIGGLAIRLADFEIRDTVAWMYGSGFPKTLDVSKALDKGAGIWRGRAIAVSSKNYARTDKGDPVSDDAKRWEGWGTALKPAFEPVIVARKPLVATVARNVLEYGTGAINIDGTRIGGGEVRQVPGDAGRKGSQSIGAFNGTDAYVTTDGRWPANVVLDDAAGAMLDAQTDGNTSRFYYTAKAGTAERLGSKHPTVKPVDLMRWLIRLVTPPGGTVLDPFAGTGTTGQAAIEEGHPAILIEREAEYLDDIRRRLIGWGSIEGTLLDGAT